MHCMRTKLGVYSSSRFSFRAGTLKYTDKITDATGWLVGWS